MPNSLPTVTLETSFLNCSLPQPGSILTEYILVRVEPTNNNQEIEGFWEIEYLEENDSSVQSECLPWIILTPYCSWISLTPQVFKTTSTLPCIITIDSSSLKRDKSYRVRLLLHINTQLEPLVLSLCLEIKSKPKQQQQQKPDVFTPTFLSLLLLFTSAFATMVSGTVPGIMAALLGSGFGLLPSAIGFGLPVATVAGAIAGGLFGGFWGIPIGAIVGAVFGLALELAILVECRVLRKEDGILDVLATIAGGAIAAKIASLQTVPTLLLEVEFPLLQVGGVFAGSVTAYMTIHFLQMAIFPPTQRKIKITWKLFVLPLITTILAIILGCGFALAFIHELTVVAFGVVILAGISVGLYLFEKQL